MYNAYMTDASSNKGKKVTINDLAGMVQRGFAAVDRRFEQIDERFDQIDRRFNDVQDQIDGIYVNYATMNEHQLLASRVLVLERRTGIRHQA